MFLQCTIKINKEELKNNVIKKNKILEIKIPNSELDVLFTYNELKR